MPALARVRSQGLQLGAMARLRPGEGSSSPTNTRRILHFTLVRAPRTTQRRRIMAKGQQRSNKEAKKPKLDKSPAKPISPLAVKPAITTVVPDRHKKK